MPGRSAPPTYVPLSMSFAAMAMGRPTVLAIADPLLLPIVPCITKSRYLTSSCAKARAKLLHVTVSPLRKKV